MDPHTFEQMPTKLRSGRPRDNWLDLTLMDYWEQIRKDYGRNKRTDERTNNLTKNTILNLDAPTHREIIKMQQ